MEGQTGRVLPLQAQACTRCNFMLHTLYTQSRLQALKTNSHCSRSSAYNHTLYAGQPLGVRCGGGDASGVVVMMVLVLVLVLVPVPVPVPAHTTLAQVSRSVGAGTTFFWRKCEF